MENNQQTMSPSIARGFWFLVFLTFCASGLMAYTYEADRWGSFSEHADFWQLWFVVVPTIYLALTYHLLRLRHWLGKLLLILGGLILLWFGGSYWLLLELRNLNW